MQPEDYCDSTLNKPSVSPCSPTNPPKSEKDNAASHLVSCARARPLLHYRRSCAAVDATQHPLHSRATSKIARTRIINEFDNNEVTAAVRAKIFQRNCFWSGRWFARWKPDVLNDTSLEDVSRISQSSSPQISLATTWTKDVESHDHSQRPRVCQLSRKRSSHSPTRTPSPFSWVANVGVRLLH